MHIRGVHTQHVSGDTHMRALNGHAYKVDCLGLGARGKGAGVTTEETGAAFIHPVRGTTFPTHAGGLAELGCAEPLVVYIVCEIHQVLRVGAATAV